MSQFTKAQGDFQNACFVFLILTIVLSAVNYLNLGKVANPYT